MSTPDAEPADPGEAAEASRWVVAAQNTHLQQLRAREVVRAKSSAGDLGLLVQPGALVGGPQRWAEVEQFASWSWQARSCWARG